MSEKLIDSFIDSKGKLYKAQVLLILNVKANNQGDCRRKKVKGIESGNLLKVITEEKQDVSYLASTSLQQELEFNLHVNGTEVRLICN